jgi:hypothetical protein
MFALSLWTGITMLSLGDATQGSSGDAASKAEFAGLLKRPEKPILPRQKMG